MSLRFYALVNDQQNIHNQTHIEVKTAICEKCFKEPDNKRDIKYRVPKDIANSSSFKEVTECIYYCSICGINKEGNFWPL